MSFRCYAVGVDVPVVVGKKDGLGQTSETHFDAEYVDIRFFLRWLVFAICLDLCYVIFALFWLI